MLRLRLHRRVRVHLQGFHLPRCGNHNPAKVSVTRRVCGYLGSPDARPFNAGKQEEVKRRVKHLGNGQIG
ncbi:anaerobic ribonucleoside-triphosphate reductase [Escherichia coli]